MLRTYTMRLKATRRQSAALDELLGELCELYNAALEERRDAWKIERKHISLYDQMRELTELRRISPESAAFPVAIQRDPLRRVDRAFAGFFRRMKAGQTPGYPRFRSRQRYDSFTVCHGSFRLADGSLTIAKMGSFRFKTRCRIKGDPRELRVKRTGRRWTATVACDIGAEPPKKLIGNAVGLDLGVSSLAVLSDGSEIHNPRWTMREEERLARANRELASKKRGSKNRQKARERLRRVHQRIAGLRSSYPHGVSAKLLRDYDLIIHEDLDIAGMAKQPYVARHILDAAWGILIYQLTYKAASAGKHVVAVNPSGTTQTCSGCGHVAPKKITRRHQCGQCGLHLGRDHNAALNILRLGESLAESQNVA